MRETGSTATACVEIGYLIQCIRTREKPTSDIETCARSSSVCLLANISMRYKTWLDWDDLNWTVKQEAMRQYLKAEYRSPWKLEV